MMNCPGSMTTDEETRINYLKECIAINPNYCNAQAQIATYCHRQGDLEQARQVLEEVFSWDQYQSKRKEWIEKYG